MAAQVEMKEKLSKILKNPTKSIKTNVLAVTVCR